MKHLLILWNVMNTNKKCIFWHDVKDSFSSSIKFHGQFLNCLEQNYQNVIKKEDLIKLIKCVQLKF